MSTKIDQEYIDLLNRAVAREFQVSTQYMLQHSKMEKILRKVKAENILLGTTTYDAIGELFKKFAIEEMKHAGAIMERIFLLGGEATTKSDKPEIGETMKDFVQLGYKAEEEALELYREIIVEAKKRGDWATRKLFQQIYKDEEQHLFAFEEYLNIDISEPEGEEAPESEWTKILTADYFELLNKALAAELSAVIQYVVQHEKVEQLKFREKKTALEIITNNTKAAVIGDLLKKIAMDEMEHYEKISERIYMLGGECGYNPDPLPKVGETVEEFLKLDHEAEDYAIVLYRKIIDEATKRGDITTKKLFEDILMQEEEHYWMFDDYF